jgi:hypothetical protein
MHAGAPGTKPGAPRSSADSRDRPAGSRVSSSVPYEPVEQDPLTLALAITETLTLAAAFTEAEAPTAAHASAFPPALVTLLTTASPVVFTWAAASSASFPCVWNPARRAGRFFLTVATSAVTSAEALALHSREATGGVQCALTSALLWQLALQLALAMQLGGVIFPSHFGAL